MIRQSSEHRLRGEVGAQVTGMMELGSEKALPGSNVRELAW